LIPRILFNFLDSGGSRWKPGWGDGSAWSSTSDPRFSTSLGGWRARGAFRCPPAEPPSAHGEPFGKLRTGLSNHEQRTVRGSSFDRLRISGICWSSKPNGTSHARGVLVPDSLLC